MYRQIKRTKQMDAVIFLRLKVKTNPNKYICSSIMEEILSNVPFYLRMLFTFYLMIIQKGLPRNIYINARYFFKFAVIILYKQIFKYYCFKEKQKK